MLSFIKNIFKETLRKACRKGDIEAVKQYLAAGANVNAKEGFFGTTPLHLATRKGHTEIVELLITAGADVNARDKGTGSAGGNTPVDRDISDSCQELSRDSKAAIKDTIALLRKHGGKTKKELEAAGN